MRLRPLRSSNAQGSATAFTGCVLCTTWLPLKPLVVQPRRVLALATLPEAGRHRLSEQSAFPALISVSALLGCIRVRKCLPQDVTPPPPPAHTPLHSLRHPESCWRARDCVQKFPRQGRNEPFLRGHLQLLAILCKLRRALGLRKA